MRIVCVPIVYLTIALACLLPGCFETAPPEAPDAVGGLSAADFQRISLNGFDPADNEVDLNDYAWSMEYFQPDGERPAYLYVGTGNDIIGQAFGGILTALIQNETVEISVGEPEIRRYREDIFPYAWETVFDYRDLDADPNSRADGFRFLRQYRNRSDGVNYLYAAMVGDRAAVWRSATGNSGSWNLFWQPDEPGSIRYLEEHNGLMYLSFDGDVPTNADAVAKIFVTDGEQVTTVVTDGFGNPDNLGVVSLASFNGWLYAGTRNRNTGYEVWKLAGPDDQAAPVRVVDGGGPSPINEAASTPCVFDGKLYLGNQLNPLASLTHPGQAADLIRIYPDDSWETVVGPDSISGYNSGFNHWPNAYIWSMAVHDGWFYVATYDQITPLLNIPELLVRVVKTLSSQAREADPVEQVAQSGADLYKTQDGEVWYTVTLDGLGSVGNYGFRTMESVGEWLYLGTANPFDGLEVWRARSEE
jgi:hypothetical protein